MNLPGRNDMRSLNPHSGDATHPFAQDNIVYLRQALDLLAGLSNADYVATFPPSFKSPIGAHVRHIADHYLSFLGGLQCGRINYDDRARESRFETRRDEAAQAVSEIIVGLKAIRHEDCDRALTVRIDCGGGPDEAGFLSHSSIARELQFLVSHTVHHYALVAVILRLQGREPTADFGLSPSTLRYRDSTS